MKEISFWKNEPSEESNESLEEVSSKKIENKTNIHWSQGTKWSVKNFNIYLSFDKFLRQWQPVVYSYQRYSYLLNTPVVTYSAVVVVLHLKRKIDKKTIARERMFW